MAQITITLPNAAVNPMIDAFCGTFGYQTQILDVDGVTLIPNPQSKQSFTADKIVAHCKQIFREWQGQQAAATAAATARAQVDSTTVTATVPTL